MESEGSFIDLSNNEQEQSSPLETSPTNTNSLSYFSSWYLNEYFKIQNSSPLSDNFIWKILIWLFNPFIVTSSLNKYFLKYNAPIPSSAPVERLFSAGGLVPTPRRNKLWDKRFEMLLILKFNSHLNYHSVDLLILSYLLRNLWWSSWF